MTTTTADGRSKKLDMAEDATTRNETTGNVPARNEPNGNRPQPVLGNPTGINAQKGRAPALTVLTLKAGSLNRAAKAVNRRWDDPAGLDYPVRNRMSSDLHVLANERSTPKHPETACAQVLGEESAGRSSVALTTWQELFVPAFAKS